MDAGAILPVSIIQLASKLKQSHDYSTTSFDRVNQPGALNHSLSMFDSEIGNDAKIKHHLSQHILLLNASHHNSSVSVPTQKILPIKKVARVAKTAHTIPQEDHVTPLRFNNKL